jgi:hypothetical protein
MDITVAPQTLAGERAMESTLPIFTRLACSRVAAANEIALAFSCSSALDGPCELGIYP